MTQIFFISCVAFLRFESLSEPIAAGVKNPHLEKPPTTSIGLDSVWTVSLTSSFTLTLVADVEFKDQLLVWWRTHTCPKAELQLLI